MLAWASGASLVLPEKEAPAAPWWVLETVKWVVTRVLEAWAQETKRSQRSLARASRALGWVELLVPRRIADEQIGDAVEVIVRLIEARRSTWCVYLKVVTTIFWAIFDAVRASGRRAVVRKKG
jgi:hypothetical protein